MNVGILGTGDVGRTLARGFLTLGHEVKIGTRDPSGSKAVDVHKSVGARASMGSFAEAAAFGDVVVVAILWTAASKALKMAGAGNLANKVVIDVTNPLRVRPNQAPELSVGFSDSAAERIQRWLPDAKVVKAFNLIGHAHMVNPQFPGGPPDMFICGNDAAAKKSVEGICRAFGWNVIDIGGIQGARLLEPLAMLWIAVALGANAWNHAFKLLRQ
jgi:8-hydroxy-5-deazaflavin:NADPH oxidoreductase